jgi:hypothetical protein
MTDFEVYGLVIIAMALSFANWRVGVLICLVVGFLQDPLRKLVPGEPVVFTALVAAPLLGTVLGAHLRKVRLSFRPLHSWSHVLRKPLNWFMLLVVIQSGAAVIKTGNPFVGAIGALSYFAPLPAILLGYQYSRNQRDIVKVIKVYLIVAVVMTLTVYLSYAGFDWAILKQVGTGLFIYSLERGRLNLFSGLLRSPEIAAWHAATAACLLMLVSLAVLRNSILKIVAGALAVALTGAILLTGRRKFLVELILFVSIYSLLLIWFRRSVVKSAVLSKSALLLAGGLVVASMGYMLVAPEETSTDIRPYYERGVSVRNDVTERVSVMTLGSFQYVIQQNGIFGSGAGTGSQGTQHFGGQTTGGAAEGGLGKVLAELGIPGFVLLIWLVISLARYLWSILKIPFVQEIDPALSKLIFGLVALLATNAVLFVIAHQVFGDPFVLITLGFFLGFVMATPKIVMRHAPDRRRATEDRRIAADHRAESDDRRQADRRQPNDRRRTTGRQPVTVDRRATSGPPTPLGRRSPVTGQ